jgi:uncharacterized membrane protein YjjP (DUF1212 family)
MSPGLPGDIFLEFRTNRAILKDKESHFGRYIMDYYALLDLVVDLGHELAMAGAETYRIEESANRILLTYGLQAEVFAIPNCLIVSIETPEGKLMTRMRRIGAHGNDLDTVDQLSSLSRAICNRKPDVMEAKKWLETVTGGKRSYPLSLHLLGNLLGAAGYSIFFGGTWLDAFWAGLCGVAVGLVNMALVKIKTNQFFQTITSSFIMALLAYAIAAFGLTDNADSVIIGALMILVPGLLFTNAMRDIIYGDTNSGVNRIVQVFLIAAALALGTAAAWNTAAAFWGEPADVYARNYGFWMQSISSFVGCVGFAILFNIHGKTVFVSSLGGMITWMVYLLVADSGGTIMEANFWASLFAGFVAEAMARAYKKPAIGYLVMGIFPLLPGAGVYYTMNYAVRRQMDLFAATGMRTAAIAGIMAVGILLASTLVRMQHILRSQRK